MHMDEICSVYISGYGHCHLDFPSLHHEVLGSAPQTRDNKVYVRNLLFQRLTQLQVHLLD